MHDCSSIVNWGFWNTFFKKNPAKNTKECLKILKLKKSKPKTQINQSKKTLFLKNLQQKI